MKSNNIIYCLFIALALLFWNPISYFFIYADTQIIYAREHKILYWIYSIIFLCGILLIYLIYKNKFNTKIKNIIFTIAFTGLLFSFLVFLDGLLGLTLRNDVTKVQKQKGFIFKPHTKARYQTVEFDFVAAINNLGLRDREVSLKKKDKYRILCFGDSYTYGWGVNIENSWPKKLEQYLLSNGFKNVEVINCGQGGIYTKIYKNYIEKVVPLLKPDLVLVGVSQLDDLAQLFENNFVGNQPHERSGSLIKFMRKLKTALVKYLKYSFKNFFLLISNREAKTVEIKSIWKKSANSIIKNFNHLQKIRFYTLDVTLQRLFKSGDLNPGLLNYYIDFPDRRIIFNNPDHPATQLSIREMNSDFKSMKSICDKYNSNLIFINLPRNYFTGHTVIRTPSDALNSYFEKNNRVDTIYRSVADNNKLPYIELTEHFIGLQNKSEYFFVYDGHPNEKGYGEMGTYIGEQLVENKMLRR